MKLLLLLVAFVASPPLEETTWVLTTLDGQTVKLENARQIPQMVLKETRVSGSSGCNRMMGNYKLDGSKLSFTAIAGTRMACVDSNAMQVESAFLQAIGKVNSYRIKGQTLELLHDKEVLATFAPPHS